ncbi:hypothetical protein [Nostoc sp. 'Peltigera membranacea cyanobiont' 213]|uniref:hypothetical protein n=1 Tax=Nostoc sp. 'Peltigera membranacea cyanobiont' 213 TaxID=2014530 RepID=UPI00167C6F1A|nr:hypothetical protein [Nostoc sp. 'Peltigera membranacea cyanobiont' 213]
MSSLVFLYAIFLTFLEGKLGHPFLEGKDGQRVQNLLQVTQISRVQSLSAPTGGKN